MSFLSPWTALLAAGITVPLLVSLYFLKLRRRQMTVPTTLLWRKAIQDLQVNAPFQKLRRNLLLLLQLLILAALLLAMARPTTETTARPGQRIAIVIDHSASMNSTDGSPTRLDQARQAALDLIEAMSEGGDESEDGNGHKGVHGANAAMIISFAERARVVQTFTSDITKLRRSVRGIQPTDQRSELGPALQLIAPHAQKTSDGKDSLVVYVLTDGAVHKNAGTKLALPGAGVPVCAAG